MDIQRVRNLTTGRLHTEVQHIYEDIEYITGETGVMTHHVPNAIKAMEPWLRSKLPERFFTGEYDPTHTREVHLEPMTDSERVAFFRRFGQLPSLLG